MQIGLAKTPTMHGGIASAEVGFTQCTLLYYSHTHTYYAYSALSLTFTLYPCISLSCIGNIQTNALKKGQREGEVYVISV